MLCLVFNSLFFHFLSDQITGSHTVTQGFTFSSLLIQVIIIYIYMSCCDCQFGTVLVSHLPYLLQALLWYLDLSWVFVLSCLKNSLFSSIRWVSIQLKFFVFLCLCFGCDVVVVSMVFEGGFLTVYFYGLQLACVC